MIVPYQSETFQHFRCSFCGRRRSWRWLAGFGGGLRFCQRCVNYLDGLSCPRGDGAAR